MRGVQRGTVDELATLAALLLQVGGEVVHELELLVQARIAITSGGQQQVVDADLVEVGLDIAAIAVGQFKAQTHDDGLGRGAGIDGHTALTGYFGLEAILPVAVQPVRILFQFRGGYPDVLQTDDIRVLRAQPVKQTTGRCGLYTVDIQTDDSHTWLPQNRACMIPEPEIDLLNREGIDARISVGIHSFCAGSKCTALWRIYPQVGADQSLFLQCRSVQYRQQSGAAGPLLCPGTDSQRTEGC